MMMIIVRSEMSETWLLVKSCYKWRWKGRGVMMIQKMMAKTWLMIYISVHELNELNSALFYIHQVCPN